MTLVPVLAAMFAAQHFAPAHTVHLALGTGMASIDVHIELRACARTTASAASTGRSCAASAQPWSQARCFRPRSRAGCRSACWRSRSPRSCLPARRRSCSAAGPPPARTLPGTPALVAIGVLDRRRLRASSPRGGRVHAPCPSCSSAGSTITTAIGTGAALGVPVAVVGTLGYVISGSHVPDLPSPALGFVHGPALLGIVAGSVLTAPVGARTAHRTSVTTLRRVYAGLLYVLATKMLWTYL